MTVQEQIAKAKERLADNGVRNPKLEAEVLAAHCLVKDRSFVVAHGPDELEIPCFDQTVERRAGGEPLAYILGWREFFSRRFKVTPAVLIPRHETEVLVETVLKTEKRGTVLDMGTGSGCIAVTVALESPETVVTAVDVSPAALKVARENADTLGAKVELIESDLFSALDGCKFDVIACNPPYVAHGDVLATEVRDHEPHTALYAEEDGTAFYNRLATEARQHLNPDGRLIVEIGDTQSERVSEMFVKHGWHSPEMTRDLDGVQRVAVIRPPNTDLP